MRGQALIRRLAPVALLWALVLPFACATLPLPFGRDQGIYAYTADRFLQGDALYRDIYVFKPPLTVFVHALAIALFGRSMTSIRELDVLWTLATATAIYAFVKLAWRDSRSVMASPWAAIAAGVSFAIFYHHTDYWNSAQTDGWANLPSVLGMLLLFVEQGRRRTARVAAGFLIGVAFLFKYTLGGLLPLAFVLLFLLRGPSAFKDAVALVWGFLASVLALIVVMALDGGLLPFLHSQLEVLLPYAGAPKAGRNWGGASHTLWLMPDGLVEAALAGLGLAVVTLIARAIAWDPSRRRESVATLAVVGWTASAAASVIVQGRFFPYHYLPLHAPMALLVAYSAARLLDFLPARVAPWVAAPALAGLVWASVTDDPYPNRLALVQKQLSDPTAFSTGWQKGAYRNRDMALVDDQAMADWLDEHTLPDERVFLWTYDPMIYFLANRRLVSRFLYTYPLVVTWGPDTYDQELLDALKATPPVVFVVGSRDATPPVMGHKLDSMGTFDQSGPLKEWVLENYVETAIVNKRFHVYEKKQPGVAP